MNCKAQSYNSALSKMPMSRTHPQQRHLVSPEVIRRKAIKPEKLKSWVGCHPQKNCQNRFIRQEQISQKIPNVKKNRHQVFDFNALIGQNLMSHSYLHAMIRTFIFNFDIRHYCRIRRQVYSAISASLKGLDQPYLRTKLA